MIAWDKICWAQIFRGLRLRKIKAVNLAFQAKLAWKVLKDHQGLWTEIIKQKCLQSTTFLDCERKSTDSPVRQSVLHSRTLIREGIRWKVGNGNNISFWWDNWIDNTNLLEILDIDTSTLTSPNLNICEIITSEHLGCQNYSLLSKARKYCAKKYSHTFTTFYGGRFILLGSHGIWCFQHEDSHIDGPQHFPHQWS